MNTFYHSGKIGDFIYSIPTIRALGGGIVYYGGSKDEYDFLLPLIEMQYCINEFRWATPPKYVTYDLNEFRNEPDINKQHLVLSHAMAQGVETDAAKCWLSVPDSIPYKYPAVVNITLRHRDRFFNWAKEIELLHQIYHKVIFIGLKEEWQALSIRTYVEYYPIRNALDAAIILKRAPMFSGNESAMLAIRQGLGLPFRVEQSPHHNCTAHHRGKVLNPITRKLHKLLSR